MIKSYGLQTFRIMELALSHALGKLPGSKLAHSFYRRIIFMFTHVHAWRQALEYLPNHIHVSLMIQAAKPRPLCSDYFYDFVLFKRS